MSNAPIDAIDILSLYAKSNYKEWNLWLAKCERTQDINSLMVVRQRLQKGMAVLEKKKLNTEKICEFFVRLQRSIENTVKKIYRTKNDNPLYQATNKKLKKQFIKDKENKNLELERALRQGNY